MTKLVGSGVVLFHRNPGEWRKVLDDPGQRVGAVEEVLRYWAPSQYQGRFTHADADVPRAARSPPASRCCCITGAANRDERAYERPRRVRHRPRAASSRVGLGHGIHSCLGAALARLESRVAFEEFAARWPSYEVDEDGLRRVHMSNVAGYSNVPVAVRLTDSRGSRFSPCGSGGRRAS